MKHSRPRSLRAIIHRHPRYFFALAACTWITFISFTLYSAVNLSQMQQDVRQRAAETTATVETVGLGDKIAIRINEPTLISNQPAMFRATIQSEKPVMGVRYAFKLTGENVQLKNIQYVYAAGSNLSVTKEIVKNLDNGISVELELYKLQGYAFSTEQPLLEVRYTPVGTGTVAYTLDSTSAAYLLDSTENTADITQSRSWSVRAEETNNGSATNQEDLYFPNNNNLEITRLSDNAKINLNQITDGTSYKIKNTVIVQNAQKNTTPDNRAVTVKFTANDSGFSTKIFAMTALKTAPSGLEFVFETNFVGKKDNVFKTVLDTQNTVAEANENNNKLETTFSYTASDASVATGGLTIDCNSYCANDGECSGGLRCWYNQCRHPDNVQSNICAPANSRVTGCNMNCSSNADCVAGLTCHSGRCRNPQNTSSAICSAGSASTTTPVRPVATPRATATPRTSPTSKPATASATARPATPTASVAPVPTSQPSEPTVESDFITWLQLEFTKTFNLTNNSLIPWIIAGAAGIIILIVLFSLFRRPPKSKLPPVPSSKVQPMPLKPPIAYKPPVGSSAPVPPPTPNIATSFKPAAAPIAVPAAAPASVPQPAPSSPASNLPSTAPTPAPPTSGSTMISRLQQRGVIKS